MLEQQQQRWMVLTALGKDETIQDKSKRYIEHTAPCQPIFLKKNRLTIHCTGNRLNAHIIRPLSKVADSGELYVRPEKRREVA